MNMISQNLKELAFNLYYFSSIIILMFEVQRRRPFPMRLYGHLMALQKTMIKIEHEYPYKFLLKAYCI